EEAALGARQQSAVAHRTAAFRPAEGVRLRVLSSAVKHGDPLKRHQLLDYGARSAETPTTATAVAVPVIPDRFAHRVKQIHAGTEEDRVSARVIPSNRTVQGNSGPRFSGG